MKHVAIALCVVLISGVLRVFVSTLFLHVSTHFLHLCCNVSPTPSSTQRPELKAVMGPRKVKSDASTGADGKS
jgi:hypothetical protein